MLHMRSITFYHSKRGVYLPITMYLVTVSDLMKSAPSLYHSVILQDNQVSDVEFFEFLIWNSVIGKI